MISDLPSPLRKRVIPYPSRVAWVRDAKRGAPDFHMGGTSCWDALQRPWSCWLAAQTWDAEAEAKREAATIVDDGLIWEDAIIGYAAQKHGFRVLSAGGVDAPFRVRHPVLPWLCVSPDAIVSHPVWGLGVIDAKTAYSRDVWGDDGDVLRFNASALGKVAEPKYLTQGAALVEAVDADWFGLVVGLHFRDVRFLRFEVDRKVTAGIVRKVRSWRSAHLLTGTPPEYDASAEAVNWQARRLAEISREALQHEVELAQAYREASAAEAAANQRKAGLKASIVRAMSEYQPGPDDSPAKGQHKLVLPDGGRVSVSKKNGALRVTAPKEE